MAMFLRWRMCLPPFFPPAGVAAAPCLLLAPSGAAARLAACPLPFASPATRCPKQLRLCPGFSRPVCPHRRRGARLPQRPRGCAGTVATAESKQPRAAAAGQRAGLLSRRRFATVESLSVPSRHARTPAFCVHSRHRHCESGDLWRAPKAEPSAGAWKLQRCPSLLAAVR